MATVSIVRSYRGMRNVPVLQSRVRFSEVLASSGISQTTSEPAGDWEYWEITVVGGSIWVKCGPPGVEAAYGSDRLILDGRSREWEAEPGDLLAFIDA